MLAVYDAMYNIDWSDDVATENVKEQFATLRPDLRNYSDFKTIST